MLRVPYAGRASRCRCLIFRQGLICRWSSRPCPKSYDAKRVSLDGSIFVLRSRPSFSPWGSVGARIAGSPNRHPIFYYATSKGVTNASDGLRSQPCAHRSYTSPIRRTGATKTRISSHFRPCGSTYLSAGAAAYGMVWSVPYRDGPHDAYVRLGLKAPP